LYAAIEMKANKIIVTGKVQGVFFRQRTKQVANKLNVKGFVQNRGDGSVYIEAEAEDETMEHFLGYCKKGTPQSSVENISVSEITFIGFTNFVVRYGDDL